MCGHRCLWTEFNEQRIGPDDQLIYQVFSVNMWWSKYFSLSMWMRNPIKELNQETFGLKVCSHWIKINGTLEHHILQTVPINMWWCVSLCFTILMQLPVKIIQWRNKCNCWAFKASSDNCQYVVVSLFLFQYADLPVNRNKSRNNWNF